MESIFYVDGLNIKISYLKEQHSSPLKKTF